ncbi:MAG: CDP-diacylglycerol--glycerol-3-phosphate 3-phosphatidyltransferase, partial [Cytophagaceae bacterium]
ISALREWMAQLGASRSVAVSSIGKIKTAAQMTAIPLLLFHDVVFRTFDTQELGSWLMYIAAILTVWSMFYYMRLAWPLIKEKSI